MDGKMLTNASATTHSRRGMSGRGDLPTTRLRNPLLALCRRALLPLTPGLLRLSCSEPLRMLAKSTLIDRRSKSPHVLDRWMRDVKVTWHGARQPGVKFKIWRCGRAVPNSKMFSSVSWTSHSRDGLSSGQTQSILRCVILVKEQRRVMLGQSSIATRERLRIFMVPVAVHNASSTSATLHFSFPTL